VVKIPLTPYRFEGVVESAQTPDADPGDPYDELRRSFDRIATGSGEAPPGVAALLTSAGGEDVSEVLGLQLDWLRYGIGPGTAMLDVGCGTGRDLLQASEHVGENGRLAGIDLNAGMVRRAGASLPKDVDVRVAKAEELPFEDGSFDVVSMNCCLSLVVDRRRALEEAHRVLSNGGALRIADVVTLHRLPRPLAEALSGWGNAAGAAMSSGELRCEVERAGLVIVAWEEEPVSRSELLARAEQLVEDATTGDRRRIERLSDAIAGRLARVHVEARRSQ